MNHLIALCIMSLLVACFSASSEMVESIICSAAHRVRFADADNIHSVMYWAQTLTNERSLAVKELSSSESAADPTTTWILERRNDGYWKIQTAEDKDNRHCLQVAGNDSAEVSLERCDDSNEMQKWQFHNFARHQDHTQSSMRDQTGYYVLQPGDKSFCLGIRDGIEYYFERCDPSAFDSIFLVETLLGE